MTATAADLNTSAEALLDRTAVLTPHVVVHKVSGTGFAVPAFAMIVDVTIVPPGGGGSSGAGPGNSDGGCGGGSGRPYRTRLVRSAVSPSLSNLFGDTYDITIGAPGVGGAGGVTGSTNANPGAAGGVSSVKFNGPGTLDNPSDTYVQAVGGQGGQLTAGG